MSLHIMRPEWLWAVAPALLLALALWQQRRRSGNWNNVISPALLPHLLGDSGEFRRRNLAPWLLGLWILAALAASGPSWQKIPQPVLQKQDALVLVLDLSYSMVAGDLQPSRIDRARQKLLDLLERRREGQTGLIAYAGDAHTVTPLTDDTPTIANLLPALQPGIMPVPGSNPAAAIEQAVALLRSAGIRAGRILLLTDGISDNDRAALRATLADGGTRLAIMGVGTPTGAPLPLPRGGFLKDENGTIVMPGLDETTLREVAADHSGRYRRMQVDDSDLDYLLAEDPLAVPEHTLALERSADAWEDQGHWLALLLVLPVLVMFRRGWLACMLPLAMGLPAPDAYAGPWDDLWLTPDQQGQRALQADDPESAAALFDSHPWAGTAAYRAGDYTTAADRFAHGDSADDWYNRGNALARAGQLDEAIAAYRESLARVPDAQDARDNLALVEQLRDRQQQEQQQSGQGESPAQQHGQEQDNPVGGENGEPPSSPGEEQSGQESQGQQGTEQQGSPGQDRSEPTQGEPSSDSPEGEQQGSDQSVDSEGDSVGDTQPGQPGPGEELMDMARTAAESGDPEKDQAIEQWLRRVPDDPSGLLREKFRYESRRRQQQGEVEKDDTYW
jgi:Ca-activated chloride channel family protein